MRLLKYAVFLFGLFVAGGGLLFFLLRGTLLDYAAQSGISIASSQGVRVTYTSLSPHGLGGQVKGLDIWVNKAFAGLTIDRLTATAVGSALLFGRPESLFDGEMYGGTFSGTSKTDGADTTGSFEMTKVALAKHIQLAGLGVRNGLLDIKVPQFEVKGGRLSKLTGQVSIINLETLAPVLPLPIKVPALTSGKASFDTESNGLVTAITNLKFEASIGRLSGELKGQHDPASGRVRTANGRLNVSLADEGAAFLGPYLPLVSNNRLVATDRDFEVTISVKECRSPNALGGNLCVTAQYSPASRPG